MLTVLLVSVLTPHVTVTNAHVVTRDGDLTMVVETNTAVTAGKVRAHVGKMGLEVTIPGAVLGEPSRVMGDGPSVVVARENPDATVSLVAPIAGGASCHRHVNMSAVDSELRVTAACDDAAPSEVTSEKTAPVADSHSTKPEMVDASKAAAGLDQPQGDPAEATPAGSAAPAEPERPAGRAEPRSQPFASQPAGAKDEHAFATAEPSHASTAVIGLLLAGLGCLAFVLARRRQSPQRRLQVLESVSLGPKRSLVLARAGRDVLVLGVSEAGITVLQTQTEAAVAPDAEQAEDGIPSLHLVSDEATSGGSPEVAGKVEAFRRMTPPPTPTFEDLLAESHEDQDLRRKLAAGLAGRVA
jgi:flagellar biogenesis protein FliO